MPCLVEEDRDTFLFCCCYIQALELALDGCMLDYSLAYKDDSRKQNKDVLHISFLVSLLTVSSQGKGHWI